MSTTDGRAIDEQQAEIIHIRAHNRLLSDTITAMQHEIDAHHVIAQTEYKELLELREIVRGVAKIQPLVVSHADYCVLCYGGTHKEEARDEDGELCGGWLVTDHKPDCLWLRAQKYVETWGR